MATRDEIAAVLDRHPTRRGVDLLRALLAEGGEAGLVRSEAERRFKALISRAGLAQPQANARILGRRRDFVWRRQRVVVEVDGHRFHTAPGRFENDRTRDGELFAAGWHYLRVTRRKIVEVPEKVIALVAQALALAERGRIEPG